MNNAKLYHKSNALQKRDAQDIINEFSHLFDHKPIGSDSTFLDIGCGAGDVLVELILPKLHENYTEVIGVDISPEMVKYASEQYRSHYLKFLKVDIQSDFLSTKIIKRTLRSENVDFITSFYCLHWIENQRWILSFQKRFFNKISLSSHQTSHLQYLQITQTEWNMLVGLSRLKPHLRYLFTSL